MLIRNLNQIKKKISGSNMADQNLNCNYKFVYEGGPIST